MSLLQISEPNTKPNYSKEYAIGIDLGTTNSVVACYRHVERSETSSNRSFDYAQDDARQVEVLGPILPSIYEKIRSVKRLMGTNQKIDINEAQISAVEVSSKILEKLKKQAEDILGEKVSKAVITVPAHFDNAARNDTKAAAYIAGLDILRLINEPTAAAVAYGLDEKAEGIYLIYDFGGGTFDVSILRMEKGVFQVIATGGDRDLGGDDIDYKIMDHLNMKEDQYFLARSAKETLSHKDIWQDSNYSLSREDLEILIHPLIAKTIKICEQTILESKIDPKTIKEIVLVGGSTRIPLLKKMITESIKKPLDNIDPDRVVAIGAAVQADALVHGSSNLLIDVSSLSIGLEVMGGINEKIINKNSPIPYNVKKAFTTYQNGQTGIIFHIVQGEREMAVDCRSLAKFELKNIPPMKAGVPKVEVIFSLDADGLLTISAKELFSGTQQIVEVKPTYGLNKQEVENMIEQSYINAKKDMLALNLAKHKVIAQTNIKNLLEAIEEDKEILDRSQRQELLSLVTELEIILNTEDTKKIEEANLNLEKKSASFIQARLNQKINLALRGKKLT
ncbi:MAG: Hsp70 family protein [Pseudomonadota bacterium]